MGGAPMGGKERRHNDRPTAGGNYWLPRCLNQIVRPYDYKAIWLRYASGMASNSIHAGELAKVFDKCCIYPRSACTDEQNCAVHMRDHWTFGSSRCVACEVDSPHAATPRLSSFSQRSNADE